MRSFCSLLKSAAYSEFLMVPKTRSMPAAAQPLPERVENVMRIKRTDDGEGSKQTYRPVTRILAVAQCHVPPEVSGTLVAQVLAVESDLVETLGNCGLVSGHDTIVSEKRGDHVDKVGPREVVRRGDERNRMLFYQS
jgi:hypothetical protein